MYTDSLGYVVQKDMDTGDVPQRLGTEEKLWYMIGERLPLRSKDLFEGLEVNKSGILLRHPKPPLTPWHTDPKRFSRDQFIGYWIGLATYVKEEWARDLMKRIFKSFLKRGFQYQNKDIGFIELISLFVRGFHKVYLWPLLLIGDLYIFGCVLNRIGVLPRYIHETGKFTFKVDPDDVGDDINLSLMILQAMTLTTPVSWLSRKLYYKFRPTNYGVALVRVKGEEVHPIVGAWRWYFRAETGGNPEFSNLFGIVFKRYFECQKPTT